MDIREGPRHLRGGPPIARDFPHRDRGPDALRPIQSGYRAHRALHRRGNHAPQRSLDAGVEPVLVLARRLERGSGLSGDVVPRRGARGPWRARRLPHAPDDLCGVDTAALDTVSRPAGRRIRRAALAHVVLLGHVAAAGRLLVGGSGAVRAPATIATLSLAGHLRAVHADSLHVLVHRRPQDGARVARGPHRALLRIQPGRARQAPGPLPAQLSGAAAGNDLRRVLAGGLRAVLAVLSVFYRPRAHRGRAGLYEPPLRHLAHYGHRDLPLDQRAVYGVLFPHLVLAEGYGAPRCAAQAERYLPPRATRCGAG